MEPRAKHQPRGSAGQSLTDGNAPRAGSPPTHVLHQSQRRASRTLALTEPTGLQPPLRGPLPCPGNNSQGGGYLRGQAMAGSAFYGGKYPSQLLSMTNCQICGKVAFSILDHHLHVVIQPWQQTHCLSMNIRGVWINKAAADASTPPGFSACKGGMFCKADNFASSLCICAGHVFSITCLLFTAHST